MDPYWSIPPWMIEGDLLDQIIAQDEDYELF